MQPAVSGGRDWQTKMIFVTIAVFTVVLTLHADWSRFNLDEWGDMVENYAWGALWQWGYFKHPPFFAWATAAWFSIMPHTDFAYYVFASLNVTVTLLILWRIAKRYGNADFQLFVILCAVVIPPFTFQAIKYNANAAMTPVWAAAFLFYLRGLERQRWYDAVALGASVGIAMLTKYHSAVLVLALMIHALADRQARPILFSLFGLVTALVSMAVFAGHAIWLFGNDFLPIVYAQDQGDGLMADLLTSFVLFLVGLVGYLIPALLLALLMRAKGDGYPALWLGRIGALRETVEGRALLAFGILPTLITIVLAFTVSADLSVVWILPLYTPLLLLVGLLLPQDLLAKRLPRAVAAVGVVFVLMLVSAPLYRESVRAEDIRNMTVPVRGMSAVLDGYWAEDGKGAHGPVMAGEPLLANGMSFYSRFSPITLEANSLDISKSYLDKAEIDRRGLMIACRQSDGGCRSLADSLTEGRQDIVRKSFIVEGFDGVRQWPFEVTIAPPKG